MEWPTELTHGRVLLLLRPMVVDDGGDCQLARLLASHLLALSILRGGGGGGGRQWDNKVEYSIEWAVHLQKWRKGRRDSPSAYPEITAFKWSMTSVRFWRVFKPHRSKDSILCSKKMSNKESIVYSRSDCTEQNYKTARPAEFVVGHFILQWFLINLYIVEPRIHSVAIYEELLSLIGLLTIPLLMLGKVR